MKLETFANTSRGHQEINVDAFAFNPIKGVFVVGDTASSNIASVSPELDPKNSHAYRLLGYAFEEKGLYEKAEECFKKAKELENK